MRWLLSTDPSLIQLLLRWTLAIVIFPHGAQKAPPRRSVSSRSRPNSSGRWASRSGS